MVSEMYTTLHDVTQRYTVFSYVSLHDIFFKTIFHILTSTLHVPLLLKIAHDTH